MPDLVRSDTFHLGTLLNPARFSKSQDISSCRILLQILQIRARSRLFYISQVHLVFLHSNTGAEKSMALAQDIRAG